MALTIHLCGPRPNDGPPPLRSAAFGALSVFGVLPFLLDWPAVTYTTLVGATGLIIFRGRAGWAVFVLAALADPFLLATISGHLGPAMLFVELLTVVYFQLLFAALFWLATMVRELTEARAELARVAVTGERLRFGRDLRDRLCSGLFEIARPLERAQRVATCHPEDAEAELAEALRLARRTSEDIRAIARGEARRPDVLVANDQSSRNAATSLRCSRGAPSNAASHWARL